MATNVLTQSPLKLVSENARNYSKVSSVVKNLNSALAASCNSYDKVSSSALCSKNTVQTEKNNTLKSKNVNSAKRNGIKEDQDNTVQKLKNANIHVNKENIDPLLQSKMLSDVFAETLSCLGSAIKSSHVAQREEISKINTSKNTACSQNILKKCEVSSYLYY